MHCRIRVRDCILSFFQIDPGVRLQWNKCCNSPVKIDSAHAVVMGDKIYVGGGVRSVSCDHQVLQYHCSEDRWDSLPRCPVRYFAMTLFLGSLTVVGGRLSNSAITGKVHTFEETSNKWKKRLPLMPTARFFSSVVATSAMMVAAGGWTCDDHNCATVEVYSRSSNQWHIANPLPSPCAFMTSTIINNTCYFFGGVKDKLGIKDCFHASMDSLKEKVAQPMQHHESVWMCFPHTPLICSAAASLRGSLVALGGKNDDNTMSSALYVLLNDAWIQLINGYLPTPRGGCTAASISPDRMVVIGGWDETGHRSNTVWIGTMIA